MIVNKPPRIWPIKTVDFLSKNKELDPLLADPLADPEAGEPCVSASVLLPRTRQRIAQGIGIVAKIEEIGIDKVLLKLKEHCQQFPTKEAAAESLGVGRVYLWKLLSGETRPSNSVLEQIGFRKERRIVHYYVEADRGNH
jgi:hypothetical protein